MGREAIILVAGMGTRLRPLTDTNHKCLTEVNGVPILLNALKVLNNNKFSRVILVVGYLREQIKEVIGDAYQNMKIEYAVNSIYSKTNTSYSLELGLEKITGENEVYIFEGDVMFEEKLLEDLIQFPEENVTVLEKYSNMLDGTFVTLDDKNRITAWTHKSKRPVGYTLTDKYKTVNIHKFTGRFVEDTLKPYVKQIAAQSNGTEPLETLMDKIVRDKKCLTGLILSGQKWFEVDDLNDLRQAEIIFS